MRRPSPSEDAVVFVALLGFVLTLGAQALFGVAGMLIAAAAALVALVGYVVVFGLPHR